MADGRVRIVRMSSTLFVLWMMFYCSSNVYITYNDLRRIHLIEVGVFTRLEIVVKVLERVCRCGVFYRFRESVPVGEDLCVKEILSYIKTT